MSVLLNKNSYFLAAVNATIIFNLQLDWLNSFKNFWYEPSTYFNVSVNRTRGPSSDAGGRLEHFACRINFEQIKRKTEDCPTFQIMIVTIVIANSSAVCCYIY